MNSLNKIKKIIASTSSIQESYESATGTIHKDPNTRFTSKKLDRMAESRLFYTYTVDDEGSKLEVHCERTTDPKCKFIMYEDLDNDSVKVCVIEGDINKVRGIVSEDYKHTGGIISWK